MKTTPFTENTSRWVPRCTSLRDIICLSSIPASLTSILQYVRVSVYSTSSHMGEFWVKGPHALDFLQKVTSNNIAALTPGKVQYTCFPNENGGIVDDLLVYHYEPEKYLLVVNASNIEKDWNWCVCLITRKALNWKMLPSTWHSLLCKDRRLFRLCRS